MSRSRKNKQVQKPQLKKSRLFDAHIKNQLTQDLIRSLTIDEILEQLNVSDYNSNNNNNNNNNHNNHNNHNNNNNNNNNDNNNNNSQVIVTSLQALVLKGAFDDVKLIIDQLEYLMCSASSHDVDRILMSFVDAIELSACKCCNEQFTERFRENYLGVIEFIINKMPNSRKADFLDVPHPHTFLNAQCTRKTTVLEYAIFNGNLKLIKLLIDNGASPNPAASDSLISIACTENRPEVAMYLIDRGADINASEFSLFSPLELALSNELLTVAERLIQEGADVNRIDNYPLINACKQGYYGIVKSLIARGANPNYTRRDNAEIVDTPLISALKNKHIDIVRLLLEHKAKVNVYDCSGDTPLTIACTILPEAVELLIMAGADVNLKTFEGFSPLTLASSRGFVGAASVLIAHNADLNYAEPPSKNTSLRYAAYYGHLGLVDLLLSTNRVDVNFEDSTGATALMAAVAGSRSTNKYKSRDPMANTAVIKKLIAHDAQYTKSDKKGFKPMHYACGLNQVEIVKLLIEANEEDPVALKSLINSESREGITAFHFAIASGACEIVDLLLQYPQSFCENENSQNILRPSSNGQTCLHAALDFKDMEPNNFTVLRSILLACNKYKVNINVKDKSGNSPLHLAVKNNIQKVIITLFAQNITIDDVNQDNETPLYIAYKNGFDSIVKLLVDKKSSISKVVEIAAEKQNLDILEKIASQEITPEVAQAILNNLSSIHVNKDIKAQRNKIVELLFKKINPTELRIISTLVTSLEDKNIAYFNLILAKLYTSPKDVDQLDKDILMSIAKSFGLEREVKLSLQIKDGPNASNKNTLFQFSTSDSLPGISRHAYLKQQGLTKGEIKELDEERKEKSKAIKSDKQEVVEDSSIAIEPIPAPITRLEWGDEAGFLDSDMPDVCKVLGAHENVRFYSHPSLIADEFVDSFKIDPTKISTGGPVADAGIKPIDFLGFLNLKIGGKTYPNCKVEYEYKVLNSEARLLLATVKEGSATLYVAYKFLPKGLHTVGAVRAEKMSIKMSGVVEVKLPTREPTLRVVRKTYTS